MRLPLRPALVPFAALLAACGGDAPGTEPPAPPALLGTFDRIQATILTPTCAVGGCHTASSSATQQAGLVLDKGVAYRNLVGASPTNPSARNDGLLRVRAFRSDSSLLYHKLIVAEGHHAVSYGSVMPLGKEPVYNGHAEFIRRWIEAGAPETGAVVDTMLLLDRTRPTVVPFAPLAPPPQGVQLRVGPFAVAPDFERELFVYNPVGNAQDLYVNRFEFRMRPNSHHFLLYTMQPGTPAAIVPKAGQVRDIRNADGSLNLLNMLPMGYHVFFAGTQTATYDFSFPAGVALRLPAGTSLDLNAHYVNRGTAPLTGEAYANLHTVPASQVQRVARTLNLGNQDITLAPRTRTTLTKVFPVSDSLMTVLMLTSHMHELGERFVIRIKGGARDGEVVYETTDWAHPEMKVLSPPLVLRRGEGLASEVTWNNTTAATVRFGLTSRDEMGIIFGYYTTQ